MNGEIYVTKLFLGWTKCDDVGQDHREPLVTAGFNTM